MNRIKRNVALIREQAGVPVMLMVKADAYGHGLCKVATYVDDIVDAFGVENVEEALRLKKAGITKEILALAVSPNEIETAYRNGITIGLHNTEQFDKIVYLIGHNRVNPQRFNIHIKVDSGMHRLGFCVADLEKLLPKAKEIGLRISGVYSHLRDAGNDQKDEFDKLAGIVKSYYPQAKKHLASSHSLANPHLRYDMLRVGIKAYEGAMSAFSQVVEARFLQAGEKVSYGDFILEKDTNTAVVFGGYADGIAGENPSCVYIGNQKCRVIGNVCMDCFVVDTEKYVAKVGEEVVLFDEKTLQDVATERNTIDYTVLTSLKGRVKRVYV